MCFKKFDDTVYYAKVPHDPLSIDELVKCLHHFISAIVKVLELVYNADYIHKDVRVPNICFDIKYTPVLIDFDMSFKSDEVCDKQTDLNKFIKDVVAHARKSKKRKHDD